jgi:predicted esterase
VAVTKHQFTTQRTARFYQLGEISEQTKEVWFVLHGYGMLAKYFIQKFRDLNHPNRVIIAPEGMQRFYLQGTTGRVGASWMTKDDRLVDIDDNISLLNNLSNQLWKTLNPETCSFTLLGFSQGCPTAARYAMQADRLPNRFIAYASDIPKDTLNEECMKKWNEMDVNLLIGDNDVFISEERIAEHRNQLLEAGLIYNWIPYQGDHRIFSDVLTEHFPYEH